MALRKRSVQAPEGYIDKTWVLNDLELMK